MDSLRIDRSGYTLVDQVEEKLIQYFKEQGLRPGSSIPNENELAASLGIGRTVLREALSRFKMTGMIQSRTKRGMTLAEPSLLASLRRSMNPLLMSETTLRDIFEMRIILELGSADLVINLLSPQDIADLEQLVENEERFGDPYLTGFHRKLPFLLPPLKTVIADDFFHILFCLPGAVVRTISERYHRYDPRRCRNMQQIFDRIFSKCTDDTRI